MWVTYVWHCDPIICTKEMKMILKDSNYDINISWQNILTWYTNLLRLQAHRL